MATTSLNDTQDQSWQWTLQDVEAPFLEEGRAEVQVPITPQLVTVVIPTLNECEAIGTVIDELRSEGFDNILIVDGHSEDGTIEIAQSRGVSVLQQRGAGKPGALDTAIHYARTPFMLIMDGDGTYIPSDIHRLLEYANDFDEVIGARTKDGENMSRLHRFGNRVISSFFKLLFSVPITDVLSGMYLLRTEVARELDITTTSFDVEVEIASQVAAGWKLTQVPIGYRKRLGHQKLHSFRAGTRIFSTMHWMANYYNPVVLVGGLISLLAIPAAIIIAWVAYAALFLNVWHSGYALFGVMLFLLATQAASVALISLLVKRSESRLKKIVRR